MALADTAVTREYVLTETARLQQSVDDLLLPGRDDAGGLDPTRGRARRSDDVVEQEAIARQHARQRGATRPGAG
jgi:hypothetical protein